MKESVRKLKIGYVKILFEDNLLFRIELKAEKQEETHTSFSDFVFQELEEYLDGKRKEFDIPYMIIGSSFSKKIYETLLKIPYGKTSSYKDLSILSSMNKAYQAIGGALHHNPIPIIIPCHRIIKSNASLGGYKYGLAMKQFLLDLEKHYSSI